VRPAGVPKRPVGLLVTRPDAVRFRHQLLLCTQRCVCLSRWQLTIENLELQEHLKVAQEVQKDLATEVGSFCASSVRRATPKRNIHRANRCNHRVRSIGF